MRFAILAGLALVLAGCGTESELYSRTGLTQAGLDADYAGCQLQAMNVPEQHTAVNSYTATTTVVGNTATTTVGPNPYASLGAAIGDSIANDERETTVRRLCMQVKGYSFAGMKQD
jgi:hypothetical protein